MSVSFNTMSTTTERPYRMQAGAGSLLAPSGHEIRVARMLHIPTALHHLLQTAQPQVWVCEV